MRSILSDLRERLEETRAEQRELEEYVQSLERLISLEQRRAARQGANDEKPKSVASASAKSRRDRRRSGEPSPIKEFLVRTMADGHAWSLDRLKEIAEAQGISFEGKSAGKVLHFTLVALKNSDQAHYDSDSGTWRLTPKGGAARQLFDLQTVRGKQPAIRDG